MRRTSSKDARKSPASRAAGGLLTEAIGHHYRGTAPIEPRETTRVQPIQIGLPHAMQAFVGNLIQHKPRRVLPPEFKHAFAREVLKTERLRIIALIMPFTRKVAFP
jgi:hypothetical protein